MRDEKGIALVIVLWGVTLLSLMAATLAQAGGLAARRALNEVEAAQVRSRLDEAVAAAVIALGQPVKPWRADGSLHRLELPGANAEIRAIAEAGKIDLNHAPPELIQTLFQRLGGQPPVLKRPLLAVAELASSDLYRKLEPLVTVHNQGGKVDWRLADPKVLSLLPGLSESQVATLVAMRSQSQYTPDATLTELLTRAGAGAAEEGGARMVTLEIKLTLASGASASAKILLQTGIPYRVFEWRVGG